MARFPVVDGNLVASPCIPYGLYNCVQQNSSRCLNYTGSKRLEYTARHKSLASTIIKPSQHKNIQRVFFECSLNVMKILCRNVLGMFYGKFSQHSLNVCVALSLTISRDPFQNIYNLITPFLNCTGLIPHFIIAS